METEKRSSVFGSILVIIVIVGLVIFYLASKRSVEEPNIQQSQIPENNSEQMNQQEESRGMISGEMEFETEVETLDTEFEDMNAEDLDI